MRRIVEEKLIFNTIQSESDQKLHNIFMDQVMKHLQNNTKFRHGMVMAVQTVFDGTETEVTIEYRDDSGELNLDE